MADSQLYSQLSSVWVVIPAAGSGQRMQSEVPKQYLKIHDKTVIEHTLDCFLQHDQIAGFVVVLSPDDHYWQSLNITDELKSKPIFTVEGGSDRCDSVMQGLKFLDETVEVPMESWVMVHDAARPCLSKTDIDSLLVIRDIDCIGGLLASPVRDTMKRAVTRESTDDVKVVSHTESRENLWHALTPQMFRLGSLRNALRHCQSKRLSVTDECSAMEQIGEQPIIVESIHNNIKITHPNDIALATFLLSMDANKEEET